MSKEPVAVADVLAQIMARQGIARVRGAEALEAAWKEASGELTARYTRVGSIRRGMLEILVAHSTLVQELGFRKQLEVNRETTGKAA